MICKCALNDPLADSHVYTEAVRPDFVKYFTFGKISSILEKFW
jgi:hypothetical protein